MSHPSGDATAVGNARSPSCLATTQIQRLATGTASLTTEAVNVNDAKRKLNGVQTAAQAEVKEWMVSEYQKVSKRTGKEWHTAILKLHPTLPLMESTVNKWLTNLKKHPVVCGCGGAGGASGGLSSSSLTSTDFIRAEYAGGGDTNKKRHAISSIKSSDQDVSRNKKHKPAISAVGVKASAASTSALPDLQSHSRQCKSKSNKSKSGQTCSSSSSSSSSTTAASYQTEAQDADASEAGNDDGDINRELSDLRERIDVSDDAKLKMDRLLTEKKDREANELIFQLRSQLEESRAKVDAFEKTNRDLLDRVALAGAKAAVAEKRNRDHLQQLSKMSCTVCGVREKEVRIQCGHVPFCRECTQSLFDESLSSVSRKKCPVCLVNVKWNELEITTWGIKMDKLNLIRPPNTETDVKIKLESKSAVVESVIVASSAAPVAAASDTKSNHFSEAVIPGIRNKQIYRVSNYTKTIVTYAKEDPKYVELLKKYIDGGSSFNKDTFETFSSAQVAGERGVRVQKGKTGEAGTIVGEYVGKIHRVHALGNTSDKIMSYALKMKKKNRDGSERLEWFMIDGAHGGNATAFVNDYRTNVVQLDDPRNDAGRCNCEFVVNLVNGVPRVFLVLTRRIPELNELLIDYGDDYWIDIRARDPEQFPILVDDCTDE